VNLRPARLLRGVKSPLAAPDALAVRLVLIPERFDVVMGSNLFGDLLSEVTAGIKGAIGIAPSANFNPEGRFPSSSSPSTARPRT
jgi:tartrate dehydrogenase/decarboxylase / D-malate dehydrogenase